MIGLTKKSRPVTSISLDRILPELKAALKEEGLPFVDAGSVNLGTAIVINYRSSLAHLDMFVEGVIRKPAQSPNWQITVRILRKVDDQLVSTASIGPVKCPSNESAVMTVRSRIKDSMKRVAEDLWLYV